VFTKDCGIPRLSGVVAPESRPRTDLGSATSLTSQEPLSGRVFRRYRRREGFASRADGAGL